MERHLSRSFLAVLLQVIGRADNWVVLPCTHGVCSRCFTKLVAAQVCSRCRTLTCMSSRLHQHSIYLRRIRQQVNIIQVDISFSSAQAARLTERSAACAGPDDALPAVPQARAGGQGPGGAGPRGAQWHSHSHSAGHRHCCCAGHTGAGGERHLT